MTVTVTVPSTMSYDGTTHTYTDDSDPITGLDGGGHVERFTPAVKDVVSVANYVVNQTITTASNVALSSQWATLTSGQVASTDYSSKAYAIGGSGVTGVLGSAKEWATNLGLVDGTYYGAKKYANDAAQSAVDATNNGATQVSLATDQVTLATTQANLAATLAAGIRATSSSSNSISLGSKTFTIQSGKQFQAGQFVMVNDSATPTNYLFGQITSYSSTSLVINVIVTSGSGTISNWNISISGTQGAKGDTGSPASISVGNPTNITGFVYGDGSTLTSKIPTPDFVLLSQGII